MLMPHQRPISLSTPRSIQTAPASTCWALCREAKCLPSLPARLILQVSPPPTLPLKPSAIPFGIMLVTLLTCVKIPDRNNLREEDLFCSVSEISVHQGRKGMAPRSKREVCPGWLPPSSLLFHPDPPSLWDVTAHTHKCLTNLLGDSKPIKLTIKFVLSQACFLQSPNTFY
jgi:hypothetical protein